MAYLRYSLRRAFLGLGLILVSTAAVFFLMRLLGNPIAIALGNRATDEEIALRTEQAGFNRPILIQFGEYIGQLASGSLGESIIGGKSIGAAVSASLPATLELGISILLVALLVGLPLGIFLALRSGSRLDNSFRTTGILLYALPSFVFAVFLKLVFSVWIPLFPASGRMQISSSILLQSGNQTGFAVVDAVSIGNIQVLGDVMWHLVLPAISVGLIIAASFTRAVRAAIVDVAHSDWYAEAKNRFGETLKVKFRHLFLPAAAPIINAFGVHALAVLSGLVFVERIFEVRGLGFLLTESIIARDYTVVQGITVVVAVIVVVINLITDLVSAAIDPRYRTVVR